MNKTFFDLQVNGYGGVDFNQNTLSAEDCLSACNTLKKDGVQGILVAIITAPVEDMTTRLQNLVRLREQNPAIKEMIYGFHIEGPFLRNEPGYRGAHPEEFIKTADTDILKQLLNAAGGLTKIVTLAPELDTNFLMTKELVSQKITVAAGHCNPTLDELKAAIDHGLGMFTHLGNGSPSNLPRHDNIIQRVLSLSKDLWICFIADSHHIPLLALNNYLNLAGCEKSIIVSDAMAAASAPSGRYTLSNMTLEVGADRIAREQGKTNFAGSAITMKESAHILNGLGFNENQVPKLTSTNPMKAIGIVK